MRPTALGALATGAGWLAVLLGFLLGSLAPAIVGLALLAGIEAARWRLRRAAVQVERDAPATVRVGQRFTIRTTATAQSPVPLWVRDAVDVPLAAEAGMAAAGRGAATHEIDAVAVEAGTMRWRQVEVRIADPWALWEEARLVPARGVLAVAPEAEWVAQGRRTGRRHTVETLRRGRFNFESLPEAAGVREFMPGDRMRDIDWARSSRMRRLHTRLRERVDPRPIIIMLDATSTMRMHRRRAKITSAARLAYALAAAAEAAGVGARIVAFDERGATPLSGGGRTLSAALERLGRLDSPIPVQDIPAAAQHGAGTVRAERGFTGMLAAMAPGIAAAPPLEAALAQVNQHPGHAFVVAILDGEGDVDFAVRAVSRLRKAGHDVGLVVPATGAHHYRRREAIGDTLAALVAFRTRREELGRRIAGLRVPMAVLRPDNVEDVLEEVAAWVE